MENLLVYGSYSRGYKAGGYNLDRFELGNTGVNPVPAVFSPRSNADAGALRFAAEKVNAFELGAKFSGRRWRSEERRVGKDCVSTGRTWGAPDSSKKNKK